MHLTKGSRVVIIGGGPAGSFFALHLSGLSKELDLDLEIWIFEPRDFNQPGPGGCNKCAGILSSTFLAKISAFGLQIPDEIIQAGLHTYVLHLANGPLPLFQPDESRRIVSVYRGSGPRLNEPPPPRSFDGWLLDQAREHGAQVRRTRAISILPGNRPSVVTRSERIEADLIVVATGVNTHGPLDPAWGYRPPRTKVMAQDEISIPADHLGCSVHIFFQFPPNLLFGGLIPKGRYANISLLGEGLSRESIPSFFADQDLQALLLDKPQLLCGCTPRIGISAASGYFSDRMVVVGDAANTRLYKDGIGSAFNTARAAAHTAALRGISRADFARDYRPVCQATSLDNRYGRILFRLWGLSSRSPAALDLLREVVLSETGLPPPQQALTGALWNMFTGDESYRKIFYRLFSLPVFWQICRGAIKSWKKQ